ncbi:hypothetical protein XI09_19365 [Bradyrhizobium sp. CCBAU 11386]|nr:hypothetical protein [Bradyrhizobium sp. CCBAU 11386]
MRRRQTAYAILNGVEHRDPLQRFKNSLARYLSSLLKLFVPSGIDFPFAGHFIQERNHFL